MVARVGGDCDVGGRCQSSLGYAEHPFLSSGCCQIRTARQRVYQYVEFGMPGFGELAARWWMPIVFVIVAGHITNVCVTLFLHRAQTHRGVRLHYIAALPMRLWLWLTTAIVTKEWVACHRKHHAFADREGDPHSPLLEGLRNILLKGAFY